MVTPLLFSEKRDVKVSGKRVKLWIELFPRVQDNEFINHVGEIFVVTERFAALITTRYCKIKTDKRSLSNSFSFKDHCLFCTWPVKIEGKKRGLDCFQVRTFDFQTAIKAACTERNDQWGREVLPRIEFGRDLPAVDAVYHQKCSTNFRTGRQIPIKQMQEPDVKIQKSAKGRPQNLTQTSFFENNELFRGKWWWTNYYIQSSIKDDRNLQPWFVMNHTILKSGKIEIKFYKSPSEIPSLTLKKLRSFKWKDRTESLDTLLKISWPLQSPKLSLSGFMQTIQEGSFPGQSSICFLPMIDMNPSDLSCIYSTLLFICKEATRLDVTPTITFDQPHYWKALTIIQSETHDSPLKAIVLHKWVFLDV